MSAENLVAQLSTNESLGKAWNWNDDTIKGLISLLKKNYEAMEPMEHPENEVGFWKMICDELKLMYAGGGGGSITENMAKDKWFDLLWKYIDVKEDIGISDQDPRSRFEFFEVMDEIKPLEQYISNKYTLDVYTMIPQKERPSGSSKTAAGNNIEMKEKHLYSVMVEIMK